MMDLRKGVLLIAAAAGAIAFANASEIIYPVDNVAITGKLDRAKAVYAPGEKMAFSFLPVVKDGAGVPDELFVKMLRRGDDRKSFTRVEKFAPGTPAVLTTSLDRPGYVRVTASLCDAAGVELKDNNNAAIQFEAGAGVAIDRIGQGVPEPEDFDDFWRKKLSGLAEVPVVAVEKTPVRETDSDICYDVKISCVGKRPVSGYLSVPKHVENGSVPIFMNYYGYGVSSIPMPGADSKMIHFNVNAHGIENGRPQEYYDSLQSGELAGYGFDREENSSPESCYFTNMILRDVRALQYAMTLPQWDGKNITVNGGSQGAFQSAAVAALVPEVSKCQLVVPWMCDLGGGTVGRMRGWVPEWQPAMGYFDTVNLAKRIQCPVSIKAGLGDYVCPPSGVTALYNAIDAPKTITFVQGMTHGFTPSGTDEFTLSDK